MLASINTGPSTSFPVKHSAAAVNETITFLPGPNAPDVIDVIVNIKDDHVALEATEIYDIALEILGVLDVVVTGQNITTIVVFDDDSKQ